MRLDCKPLAETGIRIAFGAGIEPAVHDRVLRFCACLERERIPGVVEWVPAYATVTVYYRPEAWSYGELRARLEAAAENAEARKRLAPREVVLPVLYGGTDGPDLEFVARHTGLDARRVIELHSRAAYRVYMLGFLPGFPYLGGLPRELETPRLDAPRMKVPAGSVGIGGSQTGVYPLDSPGGWRILGRTPVRLYDPRREEPVLLRAGDDLMFEPVDEGAYRAVAAEVDAGTYRVVVKQGKG